MHNENIELEELETDCGRFFSATVECELSIDNDGIGSYEFWGSRGYDHGNDFAVVDDYTVERILEYDEDGELIRGWCDLGSAPELVKDLIQKTIEEHEFELPEDESWDR